MHEKRTGTVAYLEPPQKYMMDPLLQKEWVLLAFLTVFTKSLGTLRTHI